MRRRKSTTINRNAEVEMRRGDTVNRINRKRMKKKKKKRSSKSVEFKGERRG